MKRTRITDAIEYIEPDSMSNFQACAGLVVTAGRKVLVDANMGPAQTPALLEAEQPDVAVVTHYHVDHSVWAATAARQTAAEIYLPAGEQDMLTRLDRFIDHTAGPYGLAVPWADFVVSTCGFEPLTAALSYGDGDDFSPGRSVKMIAVRTPGHSPGHSAIYFPSDRVLFTGDMGIDRFGPWYGWADCSIPELVTSICRLKALDAALLLTSHGGIVGDQIGRAWDTALQTLFEREQSIARRLEDGMDKAAIVDKGVFFTKKDRVAEPVRSFLIMWDGVMFDHHLAVLDDGGLAKLFPDRFKT